jgi:hypothetical protein
MFLGEVANHGFKVIATFPQQPPVDAVSVCDLVARPDDNRQYVPVAGF